MDNPQHYQPLSHALHPPHAQYSSTPIVYDPKSSTSHLQEEEEEEDDDDDDDDDDEGIVEHQLNQNESENHASSPASPQSRPGTTTGMRTIHQDSQHSQDSGAKRRPGRPRGSKNRKPRTGSSPAKQQQENQFYYQGLQPVAGTTPPQHPDINVHNQQYYEFQWRVLNLCAEFYNAAEELVKGTQPLVIAQSYQMGPATKVDPLVMLGDAKRICDNLLANPSQLITSPPPPMYTIVPPIYQPAQTQPTATTSAPLGTTTPASTNKAASSSTPPVISNPQSFVVSLGSTQPSYPQYSVYAAPPGQYPTTSYYPQYSGYGSAYYPPSSQQPATQTTQQQTAQTPQPSTSASAAASIVATATSTTITTISGSPATGAGVNQGAWSDEETERLKKLAEDSRSASGSGEIEWDWVVHQWGNGRTRHQILIKATSLGLKESTSRGTKRRRENEAVEPTVSPSTPNIAAGSSNPPPHPPPPPLTSSTTIPVPIPTTASPSSSSTPGASPALAHTQRPPPPLKTSSLPWPMPTVAANTPSPISQVTSQGDQQRTSYYRPRPSDSVGAGTGQGKNVQVGAGTQHQYMYQPNGSIGASRLGKENGK